MVIMLTSAVGVTPAAPAKADSPVLSCPGNQIIGWEPGLLFTPRTVETSGTALLGPCADPTGQINHGISTFDGEETTSCLSALTRPVADDRFTWDTGEQTKYSWTQSEITVTYAALTTIVTIRTDIEHGKFKGMHLTYVITSSNPDPSDCLSEPGWTSASGTVSLTIHP